MKHYDPRDALSDVHRSRVSTIDEGTRPWPWPFVTALAAALLAIGATIDLEMIWLTALIPVALAAAAVPRRAQLLPSAVARRYAFSCAAVLGLALVLNVFVQLLIREQGWPAPNTWGGAGAAAVIMGLTRSAQSRVVKRAR